MDPMPHRLTYSGLEKVIFRLASLLKVKKLLAFEQIRQAQVYVKNHEFTVGLIQSWSLTEDIIFFRGAL